MWNKEIIMYADMLSKIQESKTEVAGIIDKIV